MGETARSFSSSKIRVMLDRRHLVSGKQFGKQAHHHLAVFQHVGDAGRHAQIVLEDVELAGPGADDIDTGNMRIDLTRQIDTLHHRPVLRVVQHLLGRNLAGLEDFLVVIDVVQEHVERLDALAQARLHRLPFGRRDDARNDVEGNQALLARLLAINGKGDADAMKGQIGLGPLAGDAFGRGRLEPFVVGAVMRPDAAVGVDHFVMEVHIRLVAEILAQQVQQYSCHINNPHEIMALRFHEHKPCPIVVRIISKWCNKKPTGSLRWVPVPAKTPKQSGAFEDDRRYPDRRRCTW